MDERDVMVHLAHLRDIRRERCMDRLLAQSGAGQVGWIQRIGSWIRAQMGRIVLPTRPSQVVDAPADPAVYSTNS